MLLMQNMLTFIGAVLLHQTMYGNMEPKKYNGVGGHLFAIAGLKSKEWGYEGTIIGEAANQDLYKYYIEKFGAEPFPYGYPARPYRIIIENDVMNKIMEVYTYVYEGEVF